jgi:hypothetical protein
MSNELSFEGIKVLPKEEEKRGRIVPSEMKVMKCKCDLSAP